MRHVNVNTALILSLFLAGLGTQIAGVTSWEEVLSPAFVGGAFLTAAAILRAYTAVPSTPKE